MQAPGQDVPMPRIRTTTTLLSTALATALVVAACSGADDEAAPSADSQPAAAVIPSDVASLDVSSPNFHEVTRPRKRILKENTCYGENISPPLDWTGVPQNAVSLALIAEEPEETLTDSLPFYTVAASGAAVHWVVYNIPPGATGLPGSVPTSTDVLPDGSIQGVNGFEQPGYTGPCPPPSVVTYYPGQSITRTSDVPHQYFFRLYALDAMIDLAPGATGAELISAMEGHVLGYGETMGKYQGPRQQGWYLSDQLTPIPNTPTPTP